jgi:hypothetical protein
MKPACASAQHATREPHPIRDDVVFPFRFNECHRVESFGLRHGLDLRGHAAQLGLILASFTHAQCGHNGWEIDRGTSEKG